MMGSWRHPTFERLSRYAHDELVGRRRARVAAHLSRCEACRGGVRFVQALREAARQLSEPDETDRAEALLRRVLARRAAGERVILPLNGPIPIGRTRRGWWRHAAAALIPLAVGTTLLVGVPRLRADRSQLEFSPARPRAGQTVTVTYRSGVLLDAEDRLVLRGSFHDADGRRQRIEAAVLRRVGRGTFRGELRLPASAVYAAFVVEDASGTRADTNLHRFWEVLVHDAAGEPTFDALSRRVQAHFGRDWAAALESARSLVERHPEKVASWGLLFAVERSIAGSAALDSLRAAHLARLRRFVSHTDTAALPAAEVASVAYQALTLGDSVLFREWLARLADIAPHHRVVGLARYLDAIELRRAGEPARALALYDSIWNEQSDARNTIADAAVLTALEVGDPDAIVDWVDRASRLRPDERGEYARILLDHPAVRAAGLRTIRHEIRRLEAPPGPDRPLGRTVVEEAAHRRLEATRLIAALGAALISDGHTRAGLDTLRLAAARGWDPVVYQRVADGFLAAGDTSAALPFLAALAADPAGDEDTRRRLAEFVRARTAPDTLRAWLDAAERGMRRYYDERAVRRPVPRDIVATDAAGSRRTIGSVLGGEVTVVAILFGYGSPELLSLTSIREMGRRITGLGGRMAIVTQRRPSREFLRRIAEAEIDFPVLADTHGEVTRVFRSPGVPAYFVVDTEGSIRLESMSLEDAVRHAALLLRAERNEALLAVDASSRVDAGPSRRTEHAPPAAVPETGSR